MNANGTGDWFDEAREEDVCERCGQGKATRIGDRMVCRECYVTYGSCCMEFGADDLWKEQFERKEKGANIEQSTSKTAGIVKN